MFPGFNAGGTRHKCTPPKRGIELQYTVPVPALPVSGLLYTRKGNP